MTNEAKHTPTPWGRGPKRADESVVISSGGLGLTVAVVHQGAINNAQANADHIVKCVNLHDELVEVLSKFMDFKDSDYVPNNMFKRAEETLKKAGAL